VCHLIYIVMKFDNDTIFDIIKCWNVGLLDLSVLEISICRYCGMLKNQINPNKMFTLTDGLSTTSSVRKSIGAGSAIIDGYVRR